MRRIHVLLEVPDDVQQDLVRRWRDFMLVERMQVVGGGAAAVLAFVGVVFTYLKIDTATRGFYSRRLQLVAALATMLIVVAFFRLIII